MCDTGTFASLHYYCRIQGPKLPVKEKEQAWRQIKSTCRSISACDNQYWRIGVTYISSTSIWTETIKPVTYIKPSLFIKIFLLEKVPDPLQYPIPLVATPLENGNISLNSTAARASVIEILGFIC